MNYKEVNDYELLYMISDTSDDCIEIILDKYRPLIQQLVWKWRPFFQKTGLEIDDIEQEIQCAFVLAIQSYDEMQNTSLYTHFLNVVNNTMKHIFRTHHTKRCVLLNEALSLSMPCADDYELGDFIADSNQIVDAQLDECQLSKFISEFCYGLSIDYAAIFELYINGFRNDQIEKLLGFNRNHISKIIFRIRKNLKDVLFKNGYFI